MLGAAMGVLGGSSGGTSTEGGLSGIPQRLQQKGLDRQSMTDGYTTPAAAVAGASAGLAPNIPMSDSYNVAASSPVFPPATQDQASALFGSQNERQGSTSGFKKELKEKIIGDLNSL